MIKKIFLVLYLLILYSIAYCEISNMEIVKFPVLLNNNKNEMLIDNITKLYTEIGLNSDNLSKQLYTKIIDTTNIDYVKYYDKYLCDFTISEPKMLYNNAVINYDILAYVNIITEKPIYEEKQKFNIVDERLESYIGNSDTIIIPNEVKTIGHDCFNNRKEIKKIIIPDGLKKIEHGAFYNCFNLEDINLPNSIKEIGVAAFAGCIHLEKIELPNSISFLPCNVFMGSGLKKINIPSNVKEIGTFAFQGTQLNELTLNEGLVRIEPLAFYGTNIKDVRIPNSVKEIYTLAFCGANIEFLSIGNGLEQIDLGVFAYNNFKKLHIPKNIKTIGICSFCGSCQNLEELEFEEGVKIIQQDAFMGSADNKKLKKIIIPNSVTNIESLSFSAFELDEFIQSENTDVDGAFTKMPKKITYR